jgi:hypothetical protein
MALCETSETALSSLLCGRMRCSIPCSRCGSYHPPLLQLSRGNGHSCPFHPPFSRPACDRDYRRRRPAARCSTITLDWRWIMPRGDKSAYTSKQKRQAEHIEEGYERRGRLAERGRAPGLGDGEQGDRRREEERLGTGQEDLEELGAEGRRHAEAVPDRHRPTSQPVARAVRAVSSCAPRMGMLSGMPRSRVPTAPRPLDSPRGVLPRRDSLHT